MRTWNGNYRRKAGRGRTLAAAFLALGAAIGAHSQEVPAMSGVGAVLVVSSTTGVPQSGSGRQFVREIVDPHTGKRWGLMRDAGHPGGPGRMVLVEDSFATGGIGASPAQPAALTIPGPMIRAGDRLIVEEHTSLVEAYLEAVALGPAAAGSVFNVRLKLGGKVLRAVAIGPGRAACQAETGDQP
jgi:hypothetical protein